MHGSFIFICVTFSAQLSEFADAIYCYLTAAANDNCAFALSTTSSLPHSLPLPPTAHTTAPIPPQPLPLPVCNVAPLATTGTFGTVLIGLIDALEAVHAVTQAVVLCQFLPTVDYDRAYAMIKAQPGRLSAMLLPYVWEMPLLELLAYVFSQKYKDPEKYDVIMRSIQRPELNEHNRPGSSDDGNVIVGFFVFF